MKRYNQLTAAEKLALSAEQFDECVKLEAIDRGISLPIKLDNAIKQGMFSAFHLPPDAVKFYEVMIPTRYNDSARTGLGFRTIEEARAALTGAYSIQRDGYPEKSSLITGEFSIREVYITLDNGKSFQCTVKECERDNSAYEELARECVEDLQNLRQEEYRAEVRAAKRKEYLNLAKGDIEIAKAFWMKGEGTEFPSDEESAQLSEPAII